LAIIKGSVDSKIKNVGIFNGRHLGFLHRRHSTLGMKDEDGNVLLIPKAVYSSAEIDQLLNWL
jgi:hypothetical protein